MIVKHAGDAERVTMREGMHRRILIGDSDRAQNFIMRLFEVDNGTEVKCHIHPWEHEIFVLEGIGAVMSSEGREIEVSPGSVLYMPAGEKHAMINKGAIVLKFLCIIPKVIDESEVTGVDCQ